MDQLNIAIKIGSGAFTLICATMGYIWKQIWMNKKMLDLKINESETRIIKKCDRLDEEKADKDMMDVNLKYLNQTNEEQTMLMNAISTNVTNLSNEMNKLSSKLTGVVAISKSIEEQNGAIYKYLLNKKDEN